MRSVFGLITALGIIFILFTECTTKGEQAALQSQKDTGVTISGRINYPAGRTFFIEKLNESADGFVPYDTVSLADDNTFSHFVVVNTPGFYRLNLSGRQMINIILNKDDLAIVADGNHAGGFVDIQGSSELEQLRAFNTYLQQNFIAKENELNQQYAQARQSQDNVKAQQIQEEYFTLIEQKEDAVIQKIKEMGSSLAITQALNYIDKDNNFKFYDETISLLESEYPSSPNVKKLAREVDQMRLLSIGSPAPEIELPNPDGDLIKLSSLRGNVVLIDFWAEWCRPCRLENPNIVKAYSKYNDKGFEIFGVSLDKSREKWLQAIKADQLHWTQVSDLKYWQSEAAKTYNVQAIPMSFLLDENGIIIAKNLRGEALNEKLEEIFSGRM